jgi:hypothetical protein
MTYEEIERRYPLLIESMKWAAILSTTEAADCIRALQEHRGSGEAVDHFGGPRAVLAGALRCRRYAYQVHRSRKQAARCEYCESIEHMTGTLNCPIHVAVVQPRAVDHRLFGANNTTNTGQDGYFPALS